MKKVEGYQSVKVNGRITLNANELSYNLSEVMKNELKKAIDTMDFHRYPDSNHEELIATYAKIMNLKPEQVLAGNGSDELLGLLIGTFLNKGKKLYTLDPDFSMYDYYATRYDANLVKFKSRDDGSFSVNDFIEYGRRNKVDFIILSNPNNPSGFALSNQKLLLIVEAFVNIPVVIDEAYGEFFDETMLDYIDRYPNLYVTRTLSKAYGLAGMRLGFLAANAKAITYLKHQQVPYNISTITQKVGVIALQHRDDYLKYIDEVKRERSRMFPLLQKMEGIIVYRSHANYFYGRCREKARLLKAFAKEGIIIRNYQDDSFRITIGTKEENDLVLAICSSFLKGE